MLCLLFLKIFIFLYLFGCIRSELWHAGSSVMLCKLSCPMASGILVPQPGIELTSPGLQGRLFATGPPGKSLPSVLMELLTLFLDWHPLAILLNFKRKQGMPKFSDNFSLVTFGREEEGCLQNGRTTMQEGNSRTLRAERSNHQSNSLHHHLEMVKPRG